jgi:hypothetical protein
VTASNDDLLQPTVRTPRTTGGQPWRLQSLGYVAFLGGVIAGTTMTFLNAGRLGATLRQRWLVIAAGVLGLAVTIPLVIALYDPDRGSVYRLAARVVAVLAFLVQAWLVRPHDRAFQLRDGDYASLWGPGLAAVVACGLVEGILFSIILGFAG